MFLSLNPVFSNFYTLSNDIEVFFEGKYQESYKRWRQLVELSVSKHGYGIGRPVNEEIGFQNPMKDTEFSTKFKNIPWGRAVLCKKRFDSEHDFLYLDPVSIEVYDGNGNSTRVPSKKIHGVCYGTSIKDNHLQLQCGFSVAELDQVIDEDNGEENVKPSLAIAVFVNNTDSSTRTKFDTVVAVSDAIDPSVFYTPHGYTYLVGEDMPLKNGFSFTVRGNFMDSCNKRVPTHTSYKDIATQFLPSQIIDGDISLPLFPEDM